MRPSHTECLVSVFCSSVGRIVPENPFSSIIISPQLKCLLSSFSLVSARRHAFHLSAKPKGL